MEPLFKHDCELCVYLGGHMGESGPCDLYFCSKCHPLPTVIARYSSKDYDYSAGKSHALSGICPDLAEALKRAVEKGLTTNRR